MPFGGALTAGLIGAGGSILGGLFGGGANKRLENTEADALKQQQQQQQQEFAQMQRFIEQLAPFFSTYLKEGSPFLKLIQQASAGTTATGANNAAGMIRNAIGTSGLGYGPSGTTAAAIGELGAETNKQSSSSYLTNLLNNEALKFQAAQGIGNLASLSKPGAVTTPQFGPPSGLPGAIQGAGNALAGIPWGQLGNQVPNTSSIPSPVPNILFPGMGVPGTPTTGGTTGGGWD